MKPQVYYEYYNFNNADFFTLVLKPDKVGKFPTVVMRSPYVAHTKDMTEEEIAKEFLQEYIAWAENGYVLLFQHCRGQGKSSGEFVPYIHEREDGLELRKWIRQQDFYNGQLLLFGGSYTASLHYCTAPFEDDIIAAAFNVQDSERYRLWYRNGSMRRGHAEWHFNLYKDKSNLNKTHTIDSFSQLPIENLSQRVLGERTEDFEEMLFAPDINHPFWNTRYGGCEARDAIKSADIPMLITTGYNDIYLGGMFRMWEEMDDRTKQKSAFIVSPYNHGDNYYENGIAFEKAAITDLLGKDFRIKWFDSILKNEKPFVELGKVTYYRTFEDKWETDFYSGATEDIKVSLGTAERSIIYNPENPTAFVTEGRFMEPAGGRDDIITIYTSPFEKDMFIKGRMRAELTVSSDCDDTSFYIMVGIETENGDYSLRHDITSIIYQKGSYECNNKIKLDFTFDEYAFKLKQGQRLRIDIAPTDKNTYVCHTNIKGEYAKISTCKTAKNKVFLGESQLILPVEKQEEICKI